MLTFLTQEMRTKSKVLVKKTSKILVGKTRIDADSDLMLALLLTGDKYSDTEYRLCLDLEAAKKLRAELDSQIWQFEN